MSDEENDLDFMFKKIVLITGFGPFEGHDVNASWEAVKMLPKEEIEDTHNIELVTLELPVTYSNVDEFVPALWETHEPQLVIHVGVSKFAKELTIETMAHRKGYSRRDYLGQCPANQVCCTDGAIRLTTKLNVERICNEINEGTGMKAVSSCDAGRYLCEYIYYTSLKIDSQRSLFVHVPTMDISSPEQTASGLKRVLECCLEQIKEMEKKNKQEKD